jgi:carboxyl-terminal processing protease
MQTDTRGEFGGLGIEIGMESGVVKVISPIDDTPAARAGIKAGDYIVKINETQVQGKSLSEAVDLMRGPIGSGIELTVRRMGEQKALTFNIIREIIQIQSVKAFCSPILLTVNSIPDPIGPLIKSTASLKDFPWT